MAPAPILPPPRICTDGSALSSKHKILSKLRHQIVDQVALPEVLEGNWIEFDDPIDQFRSSVELVGGSCQEASLENLAGHLEAFDEWRSAERVFSRVESVSGNVDLDQTSSPHDLKDLDFVVYPGEFAVAENGAIWLSDQGLKHRVVFFITQFLVLIVPKTQIIHNMHQAYARLQTPRPGFGLFLSGPSKTADIEQSLVIGAHGCRELQVYLV